MRRPPIAVALLLVVLATAAVPLLVRLALAATDRPPVHTAATCSDYSNQRDAQLNKDTRDADGDGIYCESLPCPCLKPGSTAPAPSPSKPSSIRERVGRSRNLAPRTR